MISAPYIVGLTDGEGCFLVSLRKDCRIDLRFFITQAIGNKELLGKVRQYFGVGVVYQKSSVRQGKLPSYVFEVTKRDDIYQVIIPFFTRHTLLGVKAKSFTAFAQIAQIVKGRLDTRKLTPEEVVFITNLKQGMNKHYGSLSAGKPLAQWERAKIFDEAQSVKPAKLAAPEAGDHNSYENGPVTVRSAMRTKS